MKKVLHTVLRPGHVLKSTTGQKEWIVVDTGTTEVMLASISSYRTVPVHEVENWHLLEEEDCHKLKK
tara:strand:- start:421 stop:621 length:201 start_codon:yes stop_codon:yes gene_type:complete